MMKSWIILVRNMKQHRHIPLNQLHVNSYDGGGGGGGGLPVCL